MKNQPIIFCSDALDGEDQKEEAAGQILHGDGQGYTRMDNGKNRGQLRN